MFSYVKCLNTSSCMRTFPKSNTVISKQGYKADQKFNVNIEYFTVFDTCMCYSHVSVHTKKYSILTMIGFWKAVRFCKCFNWLKSVFKATVKTVPGSPILPFFHM